MRPDAALARAAAHSTDRQANDDTLAALVVDESRRGWLVMVTAKQEPLESPPPHWRFVVAKHRDGVWRLPPRIATLQAFDQHHLYVRNPAET